MYMYREVLRSESMAVDIPRQVFAGFLSLGLLGMLVHMTVHDYFLYYTVQDTNKALNYGLDNVTKGFVHGPWKEEDLTLKPCWEKPVLMEPGESQGYVTFSLINGPEYHVSQIADAVVVAKHLCAALVIPDIRGSKPGDKSNFEDVYDVEKFMASLDGVVKVIKYQPSQVSSTHDVSVVTVPNHVTEEYIAENIEPIFRAKGNITIATYFPSVSMQKNKENSTKTDSIACLAMFGSLEPQKEIHEVVHSMVNRLRNVSQKSNGNFVAIDLRADILENKGCLRNGDYESKSCYSPQEIGLFLRKVGFENETTVYITQTGWDSSLDALKDFFPKTYTKDAIIPMENKDKFLNSELEKVLDMYICSESDVFVPTISGMFYANVAGRRIGSGKTRILVPADIPPSSTSVSSEEFTSHYVSKKNHIAYSCFC